MAGSDSVRRMDGTKLPSRSCSMKRPARVPASTAVRMNSASNRMAKWYQNAIMAWPPTTWCRMWAMPTASVGAPPAREMIVFSPTFLAVSISTSGVMTKPHVDTTWATASGVVPITAAGLFIAKYTPGSITEAATSAMMATKDSASMPP
ncbi:hypothetical protein D3C86_1668470 [compost metagenome]